LSRQAGLFTWNKPAYACLATRIPEGTAITDELLQMTEQAEDYLFSLGFTDFRVRMVKNGFAGLQFPEDQIGRAFEMRQQITGKLKESFGYSKVLLDMETRNGQ
ncbi:MAG: TIGR00268 family protein, partial [Lachnospiraceae bacterium]|nr:TIGR00268 family protein [Lachnospiraceae bacterium]